MSVKASHWTEESLKDFAYRVAFDFVTQIEKRMHAGKTSQKKLADILGVSPGRVSQVLHNPGNLTLKRVVEYARALGMKAAIVAYDDSDPANARGPINAEIFEECWRAAGSPTDFFELGEARSNRTRLLFVPVRQGDWSAKDSFNADRFFMANVEPTEGTASTPATIQ